MLALALFLSLDHHALCCLLQVNDLTASYLDMRAVVDGQNPVKLYHSWSATTKTSQGWPQLAMTSTLTLGLTTASFVETTMNPVAWK